MIKIRIRNADHEIDLHFPISEIRLDAALAEIHAIEGRDAPSAVFVTDVYWPEEFTVLKGRFINPDELNYLAKRMEAFCGNEDAQFLEAMRQEDFTEPKDLINLTFNLGKYCLIQNIGDMGNIGRTYLLNRDGCIPAYDADDPKYAEIGRRLMQSGTGIVTEHGILFVDEDMPFVEQYDGQVFPPYLYGAGALAIARLEYGGESECLYLPCETLAISKAIKRLGDPAVNASHITLEDFCIDDPDRIHRLHELVDSDGIYAVNEIVKAVHDAEIKQTMDTDAGMTMGGL